MKPSPRDSAATRKLLSLLNDKATGRLEVGAGGSTLSVYVLHGEVVAAVSADDERQLLHLLRLRGDLQAETLEELEGILDNGRSVFGELLTANPSSLDELLAQRFRQNLCDYVASLEKPTYAPQKGVFVDNIQMGHASRPLVEACCAFATKAQRIDPDQLLIRGQSKPRKGASTEVSKLLGEQAQSVYALTLRIPMEPTAARCMLVDLVTEGVAQVPGAAPVEAEPKLKAQPPSTLVPPEDDLATSETEEATFEEVREIVERDPGDDAVEAVEDPVDEAVGDPVDEAVEDPVDEAVEDPVDEPAEDAAPEAPVDPTSEKTFVDEPSDEEPVADDAAAAEPVESPESAPVGEAEPIDDDPSHESAGAPRSLAEWLADATHVDDAELDIFSDHDHERGSAEEGAFSTESHNLDKVDVTSFDEDEILEAEEAPSAAKYSAPVLEEDAAEAKIEVAADMLRKIVAAFDEADGSGAGQAAMQLLVDGAPPKFAPLLNGLSLGDDGTLPSGRILANLYARPATEHRKLINDGMLDLMERALSKAADELPDELFDDVYEGVAGYKQRLGL